MNTLIQGETIMETVFVVFVDRDHEGVEIFGIFDALNKACNVIPSTLTERDAIFFGSVSIEELPANTLLVKSKQKDGPILRGAIAHYRDDGYLVQRYETNS